MDKLSETHEYQPSELPGLDSCQQVDCGLPARAGVHLVAIETVPGKQLTFTLTESGMSIGFIGTWDPAELALVSVVTSDLTMKALAGVSSQQQQMHQMTRDHMKKKGN